MKPVWVIYIILGIMAIATCFIVLPHPFQHLCLYKYKTVIEKMEPQRIIHSYNIIKMPTVCVNANDEGFARTTRTTLAEELDSPETRKRFDAMLKQLVKIEEKK